MNNNDTIREAKINEAREHLAAGRFLYLIVAYHHFHGWLVAAPWSDQLDILTDQIIIGR